MRMIDRKNKGQTGNMGGAVKSDGTEMGQIRIHENVIAAIVRKTACGVNGVRRIAGSHFVDNLAEIIGSRRMGDRAMAIRLESNSVAIEVRLNLAFGAHIPTVASSVQSSITAEVERITGLTVTSVTVVIQELEDYETEKGE
jgi:uncharacterized alkaline shock family protein YloU